MDYITSVRPLSNELQVKSNNELNEIPSRIKEDVKYLRGWLLQQPHLKAKIDDQWLITFLRGCKFSLQRAKERLDNFYTFKTAIPELFSNQDPFDPDIQEILKSGLILPLPKTSKPDGPRILLIRCENTDPLKISFLNIIRTAVMIVTILLNEDDNFVISGQQAFFDLKGITINHVLQIAPNICKKGLVCLQESFPVRLKGFHYVNTPSIFETVFNFVKPMLQEKLQNRIKIYGENNFSNIYKVIPLSVLPEEYGGNGGSIKDITNIWKAKVESYRNWFLEFEKFGVDESKRPGSPKDINQIFGVEGSFRKLECD